MSHTPPPTSPLMSSTANLNSGGLNGKAGEVFGSNAGSINSGKQGAAAAGKKRRRGFLIALVVLVVLALGLGLGLGLGLRKDGGDKSGDNAEVGAEQEIPWFPKEEFVVRKEYQRVTSPLWAESYEKAASLLSKLTLAEKLNITNGIGWSLGPCVGNTGSIPRFGIPSICLQDGPLGVRMVDNITAFPAGVTVAATFSKQLMFERGAAIGKEARGKGVHVMLGPAMGPLGAYPDGGRNWEGFGSDPYLQGIAARMYVRGMQGNGVIACAKHFLANEQERFRRGEEARSQGWGTVIDSISENLGMKSLREVYGWPFEEAVEEGVGCIMCAYNQVNGTYACENGGLLDGVLKGSMGFQGFVVSDWLATKSTAKSANSGMDMNMPGDGFFFNDGNPFWGPHLTKNVLNGTVPESRIDDAALRILAAYYQMNQDSEDFPEINFSSWFRDAEGPQYYGSGLKTPKTRQNRYVDVRERHGDIAKKVAEEGTVLLKNFNKTLPFGRNEFLLPYLAIFGTGAATHPQGANACNDRMCNVGTLGMGWGSGTAEYTTFSNPSNALSRRADEYKIPFGIVKSDTETRQLDGLAEKAQKAGGACVVFVSADSGEAYGTVDGNKGDRNSLSLWNKGDELIETVSSICENTIVVIHAVGAVLVDKWINSPNVTAVLHAHLPGQAAGSSLANILFGDSEPSGRLPYTIYASSAIESGRVPTYLKEPNYVVPQVMLPETVDYQTRGIRDEDVIFPFGFGLGYSKFNISTLQITEIQPFVERLAPNPSPILVPKIQRATNTPLPTPPAGFQPVNRHIYPYVDAKDIPTAAPAPESNSSEDKNLTTTQPLSLTSATQLTVSILLTNTGSRSSYAVPQLYLIPPSSSSTTNSTVSTLKINPEKRLRAFEKVSLPAGASTSIEFALRWKDLANWDVEREEWYILRGKWEVEVGFDSAGEGGVRGEWSW